MKSDETIKTSGVDRFKVFGSNCIFLKSVTLNNTSSTNMVYVTGDGTVVKSTPFSVFGWFWGIINFIYLLFQTLINPNYSKHGDKYVTDYRSPGSGPPKPPSKKFGGFGPSNSGPPPPPMGGCGCG